MAITYRKYIDNEDHCWYDSSNVVYSVCFDTQDEEPRDVKVVFKGGRTYLYKGVDVSDYVMFRDSPSQGSALNTTIKKYDCERVDDTDIGELTKMKWDFQTEPAPADTRVFALEINNETGEFILNIDGKPALEGVEGQVSVVNVLAALGIRYTMDEKDIHLKTREDFENSKIIK